MTFFIIKYLGGGFEHRLVIFLFFFGLIWLLQWRRGDLNFEVLEILGSVNQLNYKNIYYIKSKTKYNWNISTSQKKQKKKLQYIKFYNCFLRDFLF